MNNQCPNCKFILVENPEPLQVLKMLRNRKNNKEDEKYPLLVADFHCRKCENTVHVKWKDWDNDLNVINCSGCGEPLHASVFLGVINGFTLNSYCFSCYSKLKSGDVIFQK